MVTVLRVATRATATAGVLLAVPAVAWVLVRGSLLAAVRPATSVPSGPRVEVALQAVCAAALLTSVLWLTATATVALLAQATASLAPRSRSAAVLARASERGCPARVRRVVAVALGVALAAGTTAGPALADPGPSVDPGVAAALTGLPLPDRTTGDDLAAAVPTPTPTATLRPSPTRGAPVAAAHRRDRPAGPRLLSTSRTVLVRPGDSLWSLAAALLPEGADDAAISAAWHRLHRANTDEIGADPDLIRPGARLRVPQLTPWAPARTTSPQGHRPRGSR